MVTKRGAVVVGLVWGVSLLVGLGRAEAQARSFSLSTPGARANAMGRAFIGVADDASAAITNPAGLILLTRPQVYLEFKGANKFVDRFGDDVGQAAAISFVGVSAPAGNRFSVGFVRHEFFNYEDDSIAESIHGVSYGGSIATSIDAKTKVGATLAYHDDGFGNTAVGVIAGGLWTSEKVTVGVAGAKSDSFVMPARLGGGVGVRPTPKSLLAFDVTWVGYEATGLADNASTVNVGLEHELLVRGETRLFGRAGYYAVSGGEDAVFAIETDRHVGTIGLGLTSGLRFQLDAAVLTSRDFIVSAAFRF